MKLIDQFDIPARRLKSSAEDAAAAEQLRRLIVERRLDVGERLPPERELTDILAMTRTKLRKALDTLEREGLIWRHVGKGTFVATDPSAEPVDDIIRLGRELTPLRMMRARLTLEPAIAREAAMNASRNALQELNIAHERSRSSEDWHDYEVQDDIFHRTIVEASDNPLLLAVFDQLNQVRRAVAGGSVKRQTPKPPRDHSSFAEHEKITRAIAAHDPDGAFEAMRTHLQSVSERLFDDR